MSGCWNVCHPELQLALMPLLPFTLACPLFCPVLLSLPAHDPLLAPQLIPHRPMMRRVVRVVREAAAAAIRTSQSPPRTTPWLSTSPSEQVMVPSTAVPVLLRW